MRRPKKFVLAAVATLGLATVAVPVDAQQTQMQPGQMMGDRMGMMDGHGGMGRAQSHMMATFDTDEDGTLSLEEITAGIQGELTTYDADSNGTLSLEEFAVMHTAHTRLMTVRAFQMHDPDGDAQVTEAEMVAMATIMQGHISGRQGDMHAAGHGMMGNN